MSGQAKIEADLARARLPKLGSTPDPSTFAGWVALAYGVVAAIGACGAICLGRAPLLIDWRQAAVSLPVGALLAALAIGTTRLLVRRARWAQELHAKLRPAVTGASTSVLAVMAFASGIGEELFFRSFLLPLMSLAPEARGLDGLLASSVVFGLLHQVPGRARWAWAIWAGLMGFAFGAVVLTTGSLAGAVFAHMTINFVNLRYLRDTELDAPRRWLRLPGS